METISISKFKATCLAVLERVRRTGQPIRVTKFGKPIAEIGPPTPGEGGLKLGYMLQGDQVTTPGPEESGWDDSETIKEWDQLNPPRVKSRKSLPDR